MERGNCRRSQIVSKFGHSLLRSGAQRGWDGWDGRDECRPSRKSSLVSIDIEKVAQFLAGREPNRRTMASLTALRASPAHPNKKPKFRALCTHQTNQTTQIKCGRSSAQQDAVPVEGIHARKRRLPRTPQRRIPPRLKFPPPLPALPSACKHKL